jgi:vancomycin permeability regulator SanA
MWKRLRVGLAVGGAIALVVLGANLAVVRGGSGGPALASADCALVLGAGVRDDGSPSEVLRDRLDEGLALYRTGRVRRLIVSGDHRTRSYDEPNAMRVYLEAAGVPPEAIFMDHAGVDTYSSMWRARHVFGATRIVVVTQDFHLARAVWCAREMGMEAEGAAADRHVYRGGTWFALREMVSRTKAVLDVALKRTPRFDGPSFDLSGDGRVTAG